ncbi:MAG: hypothetical protein WAQ07_00135 [Candidatus Omnitrophota bacterium]
MGVTYKLKKEVKEFIIEEKRDNPQISCRLMSEHVKAKFGISLSKSSINALIKEAGLSAPIGRRPKKKKPHIVMPVLPTLLESSSKGLAIVPEAEDKELKDQPSKAEQDRINKEQADKEALEEEKARIEKEQLRIIEEEQIKEFERIKEEERLKQEELKRVKEDEECRVAEELERKKREEEEITRRAAEQKTKEEKRKQEEAEALRIEKEKWDKIAREEAQIKIELFPEIENSGLVLLDAADYLIGASAQIAALLGALPGKPNPNELAKVKNLIYSSLFSSRQKEGLDSARLFEATKITNNLLRESRCIRITFSNGTPAFIDSCFYAVWSSSYIPYGFSNTINNVSSILNSYFSENQPVVMFNAAGYDIPSPEFLRFLSALNSNINMISKVTLFSGKLEEIADLPLPSSQRRFFIFGLWPWQFTGYRKVDKIGEFRQIVVEELKRDFYVADIELRLSNPEVQGEISLRGVSLKTSLKERVRVVILTNADAQSIPAEGLVLQYIARWPNLEEAFEDYNRKIELFTYTANSQNFFSAQVKGADITGPVDSQVVFDSYLKALDLYIREHFLPVGYEVNDFSEMKSRFYDLTVDNSEKIGSTRYFYFKPKAGYPHLKALDYILRRFNERGIKSYDGLRAYFTIG